MSVQVRGYVFDNKVCAVCVCVRVRVCGGRGAHHSAEAQGCPEGGVNGIPSKDHDHVVDKPEPWVRAHGEGEGEGACA